VRDRAEWRATLAHPPSTQFRSAVLATPREALLPLWGVPAGRYDVDLGRVVARFRGTD
jgi:hypothetical protein